MGTGLARMMAEQAANNNQVTPPPSLNPSRPAIPEAVEQQNDFEFEEQPEKFFPYVGKLAQIVGRRIVQGIRNPLNTELEYSNEERILLNSRIKDGFRSAGQFMQDLFIDGKEGEIAASIGRGVAAPFQQLASATSQGRAEGQGYIESFSNAMGQLGVGMLKAFVTPTIAAGTGETIVNGEIVPATSEEVVDGVLSTVGMVVGLGVYGKVARALPAQASIASGRTMGTLGANIGKEYLADMAFAGTQQIIAEADEATLEGIVSNLANPLNLVFAGGIGAMNTRTANRTFARNWLRDSKEINATATIAVPSAKQLQVTADTPMIDLTSRVDAITVSDNWWSAGLNKVMNGDSEVFRFIGATADDAKGIWDKLRGYSVAWEKPTGKKFKDVLPASSVRNRVHHYFDDPFDHLVARTPVESLEELSKRYNIPEDILLQHRKNIFEKVKKTETMGTSLKDSNFKYKKIDAINLPEVPKRPSAYISKDGTILATSRPLNAEQFRAYEQTGYLPKEQVTINGGLARVIGPGKNGNVQVRLRNGKLSSVSPNDIQKVSDGTLSTWTRTDYNEVLVDDFLNFVSKNQEAGNFDMLLRRYADKKMWTGNDISAFGDFVYKRVEEIVQKDPANARFIEAQKQIQKILEKEQIVMSRSLRHRLDSLGYRLEQSGADWRILRMDGQIISTFKSIDEVDQFARSDFIDPNITELNVSSIPLDMSPASVLGVTPPPKLGRLSSFKLEVGTFLRRPDRMAIDIAEALGVPEIGAKIGRLYDQMSIAVNAMEAGPAQRLMKIGEELVSLGNKVAPSVRTQVTKALEQMSFKEIRGTLNDIEALWAEQLYENMKLALGGSKVNNPIVRTQQIFNGVRDGKIDIKSLTPEELMVFNQINDGISKGFITDERILRYIDVVDSGVDMTADQLIGTFNWDANGMALYKKAREFYKEGATVFGIDKSITGYSPWIKKWEGTVNAYARKTQAETEFLHELRRIGTTSTSARIDDVVDLAYRYAKTGIHHKAPLPDGRTAGEALSELNRNINVLAERGADVRDVQKWVDNFRGVPDASTVNASKLDEQISRFFDKTITRLAPGELFLDASTIIKLGFRPILAARDYITTVTMASMLGADAAASIAIITPGKLRRITQLQNEGYLPPGDIGAILSRNERTGLSKAVDLGMKVSLQPQIYKAMAGNTYLYTFDSTLAAFRKAGGDYNKLIEELGGLLDSNNKGAQKYFLELAVRDPIEAARYLASTNAYNMANRFGRLNNPLAWQGKMGRFMGQFGSWSLNAISVMMESVANSRSFKSGAGKVARVGAINAAIVAAGFGAGVTTYSWLANPFSMIPGVGGPLLEDWNKIQRGISLAFDPFDEGNREMGRGMLLNLGIKPVVIKDLMEATKIWEMEADAYKTIMRGSGMRLMDE